MAETTLAHDALAGAILTRSALRIAVLILGAAVLARTTATFVLRLLDRLSCAMSSCASNDLTPISIDAPAKLRPILDALNLFLARLSKAMATLQNLASNSDLRIRTPLTVARTQLAVSAKAATA